MRLEIGAFGKEGKELHVGMVVSKGSWEPHGFRHRPTLKITRMELEGTSYILYFEDRIHDGNGYQGSIDYWLENLEPVPMNKWSGGKKVFKKLNRKGVK